MLVGLHQIILTLLVPCHSESYTKIKVNLNFYFHTSSQCLKRIYEGLEGIHISHLRHHKRCETKNLTYFSLSLRPGQKREGLTFPNHEQNLVASELQEGKNTLKLIEGLTKYFTQFLQQPNQIYETLSAIWFYLYNLKNVKNSPEGVLLLVKQHAK